MHSDLTEHTDSDSGDSFKFIITEDQAGVRLDQFLVQVLPDVSRAQIIQSNKNGLLLVNGVVKKNSYKLKSNDSVTGTLYEAPSISLAPQKVEFEIIFEDEHLLVISKPPGVVVHPGSGNTEKTLVHGLLYHCEEIQDVGDVARPGIVHRLDKDTSGVMVVAKSNLVLRKLIETFKDRGVHKVYYAIVKGVPNNWEGRIVAPIGRHPKSRQKMAVCERLGKYAATNWELVEELYGENGSYSLVRVHIETGRTHQIRVHMAHIGHPVAGDQVYSRKQSGQFFDRQMLHASRLRFDHPIKKETVTFTAPLWSDFQASLGSLGWSGSLE